MKKSILLVLLVLLTFLIKAQDSEIISLVSNTPSNKYEEQILADLVEKLNNSVRLEFQLYYFNEEEKLVVFKGEDEKFSKLALIIDPHFNNSNTPEIIIERDTSDKIISAYMDVAIDFTCNYKIFDIGSSKVIYAKQLQMEKPKASLKPERIEIDTKKYLKGKLPSKNTSARKKLEALIYKNYQDAIHSHYVSRLKKDNSIVGDLWTSIISISDKEPFAITPINPSKSRIPTFAINAGKNQDIAKFEVIEVFRNAQIEEVQGFKRIGSAIITKSEENESTAKFVFSGSKALKDAIDDGAQVLGVRNTKLLIEDISLKEEVFRVSLEKECVFCDFDIQEQLSNLYFINYIDRGDDFISKSFIEKYKTEKFIDDKVEDVIGVKEGVDYIITTSEELISFSNTKTGEITQKEKDTYKNDIRSIFLGSFEPEMRYIGVAKEKKGKVRRIFVYSPYGFKSQEYIKINLVTFEEVSGKKYARTKQLGTAQFVKNHIDLVGEFILQRHSKKVSEAILDGATLSFEY